MQGNIMEKGKNETYKSNKIFLRVIADMSPNRLVFPQKIIWEDGREFIIQKVTDVRRQFVAEIGEHCTKYYCVIDGRFKVLCLNDDMRWFVLTAK